MKQHILKGQLLLELLLAISALAIVVAIGGHIVVMSLQGNKISGERDVATGLARETFEAVRNMAVEDWSGNIYTKGKGSSYYYPQKVVNKWTVAAGQEAVSNTIYTRSFTIQNVCRDNSSRSITGITDNSGSTAADGSTTLCAISGGTHDPSTQRITVSVSWPNADALSSSEYITRWMNQVCVQTDWTSANPGGSSICPTTTYDSKTNITPGANLQLCSGGC